MKSPKSLLAAPIVYETFQWMIGNKRARSALVDKYIQPNEGMTVLDIGCGPASMLEYLGQVRYVGCDTSERYIDEARQRYGDRAEFYTGDVAEAGLEVRSFDRILLIGVLHHVDDDTALSLLQTAKGLVKPGGRLLAFEPHLYPGMNPISRTIIQQDRGGYIRSQPEYESLCRQHFKVEASREETLLRVPYSHLILECTPD